MKTNSGCKRVVLAGKDGCRVLYCEECNVTELEIGAMSLRLEAETFNSLGELMQEALAKLGAFHAAKIQYSYYKPVDNLH